MKFDLHIHTKYSSDGYLRAKEIVEIAKNKNLDGIAITDHNIIKGGLKTKQYESDDFKIIIGSEIMTNRGEITGLFIKNEIDSNSFQKVIKEIKSQGGLVIIPHPFDKLRSSAFDLTVKDIEHIDAIEVFNSRCVLNNFNKEALEFAQKYNLPMVAGSDAHFKNEIGNAGIITEEDDLKKAILEKDVEIFGKKSSPINHGYTKVLNLWRKRRSG